MKGRFFSLDVLRGVAVLLVVFRHTDHSRQTSPGVLSAVATGLQEVGWVGVELFFVLSGFLISGLLYEEFNQTGRLSLGRFWLRRGLKIWPSYFAAYGTMFVLWCCRDALRLGLTGVRNQWTRGWPNMVFLQNYLPCEAWQHSWSIAVEEHFYLLLPLLVVTVVWCTRRVGRAGASCLSALPWVCLAIMLGVLAIRVHAGIGSAGWHYMYYRTHCRIDSLCAGVLLGYAFAYHRVAFQACVRRWRWLLLAGSAVLVTMPAFFPLVSSRFMQTFGFTGLYLGFGAWVALAAAYPQAGSQGSRVLRSPARWLALTGIYSYTIYLAHSILPAMPGWERTRQWGIRTLAGGLSPDQITWLDRGVFVGASVVLGVILSHAVERPALRWRKRLFPSIESVALEKL